MRIKILSTALKDLSESLYEKQGEGLGEYFFDSLFSDIDSLMLYGGIHPKFIGDLTACCPKDSLTLSITGLKQKL